MNCVQNTYPHPDPQYLQLYWGRGVGRELLANPVFRVHRESMTSVPGTETAELQRWTVS